MRRFSYFAPRNISEAVTLLHRYKDGTKLLAGGTDLLVQIKNNEIDPSYLIDLKKIPELTGIRYTPDKGLSIYPLTTISQVESSNTVHDNFPVLVEAARTVGSVQIRNRATVGGNICRAAPSADLVPALLVLNARLKIKGLDTERIVSLEDFFVGPGKTILKHDEILSAVIIPKPHSLGVGVYLKHGPRQTMDLATVGVAVFIVFERLDYTFKDIKLALASVSPIPLRAKEAEKVLIGKKLTQIIVEEAASIASEEATPINDVYGPDWYKKEIVRVLVKRAIVEARAKVRE